MRRPKIGFALAILLLGLPACDNGNGPGGKTGGAGGTGGSAGGATSTAGTGGSTIAGGSASGGLTSVGGSASGGTTGAGGSTRVGGATSTAGTTGTAGTNDTSGSANAGATGTGGSTGAGGTTSASGGTPSAGGSTGASSSTGGAAGGRTSASGGAGAGSQPDAGADATADGTDSLPDSGRDATAARDLPTDTSVHVDSAADSASDTIASSCVCLGKPAPVCTPTGHLTYTLTRAGEPTADQADAYNQITCAMDMAVAYYNCYANITGSVRVSYDTGVVTADGNINGSIRFGAGRGYMQCATAMHEIAHTQGIGTAAQWAAHVSGNLFVGTNAAAQLQAINATLSKPLDTAIHADSMHFWPYGLNYETEATGTDILVGHCQIVVAIRKDLGLQP